jgi:aspartyl protease family protein
MRLIVVLAILGLGLAVLIFNHDAGESFGIRNDDFGSLVATLPIILMLSAGIVASRRSFGQSIRQLAIWVLITLVLVTGYLYRRSCCTNRWVDILKQPSPSAPPLYRF